MRQFRVLVNGNEYKVAIEELQEGADVIPAVKKTVAQQPPAVKAEKPEVKQQSAAKPEAKGSSSGNITAAMPGTILDIKVSVGDSVSRGQTLLILEAMKMENEIMAPSDGVIGEIFTTKGASVNSGDLLLVMS